MSKADYLKRLRLRFPEEPDTVLELGWHFHDMEKTKHYIRLLGTCNSNADIAWKAIREMYVAGDIDGIKAKNKRFIKALLPFTCLDREGNPHSIAYHIRAMLDDPQVKAERQASQTKPKQVKESRDQQQPAQALPKRDNGIIIQIMPDKSNEEFLQKLLELAEKGKIQIIQQGPEEKHKVPSEESSPSSVPPRSFYADEQQEPRILALARTLIDDEKQWSMACGQTILFSPLLWGIVKAFHYIMRGISSACYESNTIPYGKKPKILCQHKGVTIIKIK